MKKKKTTHLGSKRRVFIVPDLPISYLVRAPTFVAVVAVVVAVELWWWWCCCCTVVVVDVVGDQACAKLMFARKINKVT